MDALTGLRRQLDTERPYLARAMLERFAQEPMSAEAGAVCGAGSGVALARADKQEQRLLHAPLGYARGHDRL
jgi:hypothetical protein